MSRHLYSGNAAAYQAVITAVRALGFSVKEREFHDVHRNQACITLKVLDAQGNIYGNETFTHWDIDVLYNTATSWLTNLHASLKTWS